MNYKSATLALLFSLTQPLWALPNLSTPPKCPNVSTLQSVGVNMVSDSWPGWWVFSNKWTEDDREWSFATLGIDGTNEEEVLAQLKKDLQQVSYLLGPESSERNPEEWSCFYGSENVQSMTIATTPSPMNIQAVSAILAKFKR